MTQPEKPRISKRQGVAILSALAFLGTGLAADLAYCTYRVNHAEASLDDEGYTGFNKTDTYINSDNAFSPFAPIEAMPAGCPILFDVVNTGGRYILRLDGADVSPKQQAAMCAPESA